MGFLAALIQTVIKMIIVGAFAFVGIKLGRYLRKRKDDKEANTQMQWSEMKESCSIFGLNEMVVAG